MYVHAIFQFSSLSEINGQNICTPMYLFVRIRGMLILSCIEKLIKKKNIEKMPKLTLKENRMYLPLFFCSAT